MQTTGKVCLISMPMSYQHVFQTEWVQFLSDDICNLFFFSSSLTLIWGPHTPCMQAHINAITLSELHPMNTFLNFNFFSLVHFSKWFFSLFAKDYHGPCMTTTCHAEDIKEKVLKQSLSIRMAYGLFLSTYLSLFSCYDKTPWPRQHPYLP